ncbi:hypothetical protein QEO94_04140 [Kingella negevensis]|nr:hypothetical protein [Kingella negevensis]MDK4679225.1 hypothetical protein [Kingella negevensis]MDK4683053.1 hypothetical protein [Kingella negevensis]MDK4691253.1 hypothetical protein [Kingella negevensis]MDK4693599.1 hypothetical protein [Kingella negevensis]MDK4700415.1 hypothetical protein [Kingella negevensis]
MWAEYFVKLFLLDKAYLKWRVGVAAQRHVLFQMNEMCFQAAF